MEKCDLLFGACIVISVVALISILRVAGKMPCKEEYDAQLNFCIKKRNLYLRSSVIWHAVYYTVTLVSLLATVIVIYLTTFEKADLLRIFVYSVISLFATVINFVLNPNSVAVGYRECFTTLDYAISKIINGESDLVDTVHICEDKILALHK